jgi:hypothetical protein
MADNAGLLKIGLFAGAAYLAYSQGWLSALGLGLSTVAPSSPGGAVGPVAGSGSSTTLGPSLASLYSALVKASANDAAVKAGTAGPDTYNVYLVQVYPALGAAPDPVPIFGGRPAMTAAQYWAGISPWLATNKGLSGANAYAGLAGIAARYRMGAVQ